MNKYGGANLVMSKKNSSGKLMKDATFGRRAREVTGVEKKETVIELQEQPSNSSAGEQILSFLPGNE